MKSGDVRFGTGLFAASLVLLLVRFLVPRPVGAADNGDGWRLLCQLGGREPDRISEDFVRFAYRPSPDCHSGYVSSQLWMDKLAQWIGHLLGSSAAINLIVVGVLACMLGAAAVTSIVLGLPLGTRERIIASVLVLLVLADSAIFGWFASVLSEGAAFLGIALTAGGLLLLQREDRWRYGGAALTFAGAVLGINAKAQTLLVLPVLALALLCVRKTGATRRARWVLPVVVLVATAGGTALIQGSGDPAGAEYRQANAYHTIFFSIVDGRHDTAGDLAALGLPQSFSQYIDTNWWGPRPATKDPAYPLYRDRFSMRNVAQYYLHHPGRTVQILHEGAKDLLTARPGNIGSFGEHSGQQAMAQEFRVPLLSGVTRLVAPLGLFFLLPLWLLIGWAAIRSWRRLRPVGVVTLFLLGCALGQFGLAALAEGIEGVKHQVIALFCTLLAAALAGSGLLPRPAGTAVSQESRERATMNA